MNLTRAFRPLPRFAALWLMAGLRCATHAANPILHGFADPAMREWTGRMYLCVGKDLSPTHKGFAMPYWAIYSSSDLVNWTQEKIIDPAAVSFMGKGNPNCWAADLMFRNNQFYFYFSDGGKATGVLVADRPDGEYRDVLKTHLLPPDLAHNSAYDPTIFTDSDGTSYLTFGRDGHLNGEKENRHYKIAKLNPDLISLAETPRDLLTDQPYGFGNANRATDHSYFHRYKDTYYLSRDQTYMTSKSVYGPFERPRNTGQSGHSCFISYHGQWYHGYEFTDEEFGVRTYRQVMLTYLHYKDNGDMIDDRFFIKGGGGYALGVGNYDAAWDRIEAEWFFEIYGAEKRNAPGGGFEVRPSANGAYLKFPQVRNLAENSPLFLQVSSANPHGGKIAVHAGSPEGRLLGTCEIPCTMGWEKYQRVSCGLKNSAGTVDLCLVFESDGEPPRLDWMSFKP